MDGKRLNLFYCVILVFISVIATGAVNYVYASVAFGVFAIVLYQTFIYREIYFSFVQTKVFGSLIIAELLITLFGFNNFSGALRFLVAPIVMFGFGWILVESVEGNEEQSIKRIVVMICVGCAVHAFLNYTANIGRERWMLIDYFSKKLTAATMLGMTNTLIFSLIAYFFLEKNNLHRVVLAVAFTISLINALQTGSRTQFLIMLVVLFIVLVYMTYSEKGIGAVVRVLAGIVLLAALVYLMYSFNILGIRSSVESTNLYYRLTNDTSDSDNERVHRLIMGFQSLYEYPFGNPSRPYYHNLWLDGGRVGGVGAFVFLLVYTLLSYRHLYLILSTPNVASKSLKALLLGTYVGYGMNFFVEPVLEGATVYYYLFLVINGACEAYYFRFIELSQDVME